MTREEMLRVSEWEMVGIDCLSSTISFYSLDIWQETSFEVNPPQKLTSGALEWAVDVLSVSRDFVEWFVTCCTYK